MSKSKCLKIPKIQGETALALARRLELIDKTMKIQKDEIYLYVPLLNKLPKEALKSFQERTQCQIVTNPSPERNQQQLSLLELLKSQLPADLLPKLPHAIDVIGDIGIVEIPSELQLFKNIIGEAILGAHKNLHTVLAKVGAVSGSYRLREFTTIAGVRKTETIHREYGCRFYLDVAKTYFSPRLSFEHNRVASLVQEGETVVDLFSGIGSFAIMIARRCKSVKVYAVDINPDAVDFLKRNIRLNRVDRKVHPIFGDARQVLKREFSSIADRVIMNLPETASEFVDTACQTLKPQGGVVHFYSFTTASVSLENIQDVFSEAVKRSGRKVEAFLFCRSVRETAPHENQVVLDVKVR